MTAIDCIPVDMGDPETFLENRLRETYRNQHGNIGSETRGWLYSPTAAAISRR